MNVLLVLGIIIGAKPDTGTVIDKGTFKVYQRERALGTETFEYLSRGDSLTITSHVAQVLPGPDGDLPIDKLEGTAKAFSIPPPRRDPPVVVVILDEFPIVSLMDASHRIDAVRDAASAASSRTSRKREDLRLLLCRRALLGLGLLRGFLGGFRIVVEGLFGVGRRIGDDERRASVVGEEHGTLKTVFELANIAGPTVSAQRIESFGCEFGRMRAADLFE